MKEELLIIITSANAVKYTEKCLDSLCPRWSENIIIIDDASMEPIEEICEKYKVRLIKKERPSGCTDSWNRGALLFKNLKKAKYCLISNNDVIFSKNSIDFLLDDFKYHDLYLIGPMTNNPGHKPKQHINTLITQLEYSTNELERKKLIDWVQETILRISLLKNETVKIVSGINGFCFLFDKRIFEFSFDDKHLFNPKFINIGNEDWLCERIYEKTDSKIGISLRSYVFHYKSKSVLPPGYPPELRNKIWNQISSHKYYINDVNKGKGNTTNSKGGVKMKIEEKIREILRQYKYKCCDCICSAENVTKYCFVNKEWCDWTDAIEELIDLFRTYTKETL